jgi:hypothetical protein
MAVSGVIQMLPQCEHIAQSCQSRHAADFQTSTMTSGWSTPLSSSTTLSSPTFKGVDPIQNFPFESYRNAASTIVEFIASRQGRSSTVYVYDVAEQVGFGTQTKEWAKTANRFVANSGSADETWGWTKSRRTPLSRDEPRHSDGCCPHSLYYAERTCANDAFLGFLAPSNID